jgi:uncharacterized protein YdaU (DUF1376 family)
VKSPVVIDRPDCDERGGVTSLLRRIEREVGSRDSAVASKKPLPMLPWYPASFMSSTRGWSVTARGIYRELLDCQWEMHGLPDDPEKLRKMISATQAEWKQWPVVESKFPVWADGLRRNPTLERHRQRSIEKSEAATAAARQRWGPPREHARQQGASDANA